MTPQIQHSHSDEKNLKIRDCTGSAPGWQCMCLQYLLYIRWRNLGRSLPNYLTFTKMLASRRNIFTGSVVYVQYINYNMPMFSISYNKETMRQSMGSDKNSLTKLQITLPMGLRLSSSLMSMPLHFQVRIVELSPKLSWGVKVQEISILRIHHITSLCGI